MNSPIFGVKTIPSATEWTDLATMFGVSSRLAFAGIIGMPDENAGNVTFKVTTGNLSTDVPAKPGQTSTFLCVPLSAIYVKGAVTDSVSLFGEGV